MCCFKVTSQYLNKFLAWITPKTYMRLCTGLPLSPTLDIKIITTLLYPWQKFRKRYSLPSDQVSHDSPWHIHSAYSNAFSPYYNLKEEVPFKRPPHQNKLFSLWKWNKLSNVTYSIQQSNALDNFYPKNHHLLTLHSISHTWLCNRLSWVILESELIF